MVLNGLTQRKVLEIIASARDGGMQGTCPVSSEARGTFVDSKFKIIYVARSHEYRPGAGSVNMDRHRDGACSDPVVPLPGDFGALTGKEVILGEMGSGPDGLCVRGGAQEPSCRETVLLMAFRARAALECGKMLKSLSSAVHKHVTLSPIVSGVTCGL